MSGHQALTGRGPEPHAFLLAPHPLPAPVQGAPKEVVDPSSGRATLLESIRQAGGIGKAKLRSVKERKLEKKKQKEQEQGEALLSQQLRAPSEGPRPAGALAGCPPQLPQGTRRKPGWLP